MPTKHTPEPYSISGITGDNHIMAMVDGIRRTVAIVPGWPGISPMCSACGGTGYADGFERGINPYRHP